MARYSRVILAALLSLLISTAAFAQGGIGGGMGGVATTFPPSGAAGGDLTGTYPNPTLVSIATAGTTGSSTAIPVVTIDVKGRVTSITTATIAAPLSGITGAGTGVVMALGVNIGSAGAFLVNGTAIPASSFPALTGDITTTAGSLATTLASVATAGTTGSSTAIPVITIDIKGRTTGITTAAVVAPAGTLSGATLAAGVTASSLTSAAGGAFGTNAYSSVAFAPLASPTFTGTVTGPDGTTWTSAGLSIPTTKGITMVGNSGLVFSSTGGYVQGARFALNYTGVGNLALASAAFMGFVVGNDPTQTPDTYFTRTSLGNMKANGTLATAGYTVAGLPATPGTGARAYVTDQLTTCAGVGVALTGGGAVTCPAFYNGTAWVGG